MNPPYTTQFHKKPPFLLRICRQIVCCRYYSRRFPELQEIEKPDSTQPWLRAVWFLCCHAEIQRHRLPPRFGTADPRGNRSSAWKTPPRPAPAPEGCSVGSPDSSGTSFLRGGTVSASGLELYRYVKDSAMVWLVSCERSDGRWIED